MEVSSFMKSKSIQMLGTLLGLNLVALTMHLEAGNLSSYRDTKSLAAREAQVSQEIAQVQAYTGIHLPPPPAELLNIPFQRPHRHFSSTFIRGALKKAAQALMEERRWGKLPVNDPSKFSYEKESEQNESDLKILERNLGPSFLKLMEQMLWEAQQTSQTNLASVDIPATELQQKLKTAVSSYLLSHEPALKTGERALNLNPAQPLSQSLGSLEKVDVYAGVITRLIFDRKTAPSSPSRASTISLSLSSLISVRTQADYFFVRVIQLLQLKIDRELKTFYKENGQVRDLNTQEERAFSIYKQAREMVSKNLDGALRNQDALMSLSQTQLDYLIALMLTLRGKDLPVGEDIDDLSQVVFQKYTPIKEQYQKALADYARSRDSADKDKAAQLKTQLDPLEPDLAAYEFYTDLADQWYQYKETLASEARSQKVIQPIIEKIIKEGVK